MSRAGRIVRGVGLGLAALAVLALVLLAALYLNRRAAARELLVGWLERRGVDADVEIERIELNGLTARVRVGDEKDPDFAVQRVEVDYMIGAPWSASGLGVTPSRVRLVQPVLRARWADQGLSLGSLDPIIETFTRRPPRPDSRAPLILVEDGRVHLDTASGRLSARGAARLDDGKLTDLDARLIPATLSGDIEAQGLTGAVRAHRTGDRLNLRLDVAAARARSGEMSVAGGRITVSGQAAYPDLKRRRGDGRLVLDVSAEAGRLEAAGTRLDAFSATGGFDGTTAGWIETFAVDGRLNLRTRLGAFSTGDLGGRDVTLTADGRRLAVRRDGQGVTWRTDGPAAVRAARLTMTGGGFESLALDTAGLTAGGRGGAWEAEGPMAVRAGALHAGDLKLTGVEGRIDLDARTDGAVLIQAGSRLDAAGGAWPILGPAKADDPEDLKAMKSALGDFTLSAPSVRLTAGSPGVTVSLDRPVEARPRNGGLLRVAAVPGRPVFTAEPGQAGGGALTLTAQRGRGLPELAVDVARWRLTPGGFEAALDGRAALDFDLFRGVEARTRGNLISSNGRLTFVSGACAEVSVQRLELDENDITDVSGRFCPEGGPLIAIADGGWTARGRLEAVDAAAPFLEMRFREAAGRLTASGGPSGVALNAAVDRAQVVDAAAERRFNPLTASGSAALADERWSGGFDLTADGHPVGRLTLAHDGRSGVGGIEIETPTLAFVEGGLQPLNLSPLVEPFVQSPAVGSARFSGRIGWRADGEGDSQGLLVVPGLDFASPAGAVKGLRGEIEFTSLVPLVTAPGQTLTVDSVETLTPLTQAEAQFSIDQGGLNLAGADVRVAGGRLLIEPFTVPLDPSQEFEGVVVLDRVQLGELLAGSGFGDKARLDAVVSGRLPFRSTPDRGVQLVGGHLYAVQPGRLSIQREALSGVEAGGGGAEVPPNTVQDLAYQAMENLAFDTLTAEVNSLDEGRLGVLFHIRGRHDPPQRQELRLGLSELISREFLKRDLPLPSGTGVDLTLDTTLNADQLFGDLLAVNRARNGEATGE
ncbi:MAG: YdbH domain-containing protein [Brevundimonas sp.]|uniref:intermembrane phospholipid transport protein YdbH family protein n=1 Tax=Brevundimonas sp. TaxID=1871086 RepID=UPI0025BE7361|nr:YdbH domain-containing protein [Brevundimonas sp.]MBX3478002.1 YdbH domain-containing protein [Brevundimonas sp.]